MIFVYLACLIIGMILLGGSLLLGAVHADADADHDADAGVDADSDADADADHDADGGGSAEHGADADAAGVWLPFLSLRFWIFAACFFGLCGTLLTMIQSGPILTAVVSTLVGLGCGSTAAYVIHRLARLETTGDVPTEAEFVGKVADVLVEISPDARGKVRVSVRNQEIDLVATTTDEKALASGEKALVVEYKDNVAVVTRSPIAED